MRRLSSVPFVTGFTRQQDRSRTKNREVGKLLGNQDSFSCSLALLCCMFALFPLSALQFSLWEPAFSAPPLTWWSRAWGYRSSHFQHHYPASVLLPKSQGKTPVNHSTNMVTHPLQMEEKSAVAFQTPTKKARLQTGVLWVDSDQKMYLAWPTGFENVLNYLTRFRNGESTYESRFFS